jgi:hypothetical protein
MEVLKEGRMIDGIILLVLGTRLLKPFKKWDAYKLGLIDEKGEVIRKPGEDKEGNKLEVPMEITKFQLAKEKDAWSLLNRFLAKIKKALTKHKLLAGIAIYYTFIKENKMSKSTDKEVILENIERKQRMEKVYEKYQELLVKEDVSEQQFIDYMAEKIASEKDLLDE